MQCRLSIRKVLLFIFQLQVSNNCLEMIFLEMIMKFDSFRGLKFDLP